MVEIEAVAEVVYPTTYNLPVEGGQLHEAVHCKHILVMATITVSQPPFAMHPSL